jgi:hypothetical protein
MLISNSSYGQSKFNFGDVTMTIRNKKLKHTAFARKHRTDHRMDSIPSSLTISNSYAFSKKVVALARFNCLGCGINVIKAGDYCMLTPHVWRDQLHLEWEDNMCVKCIELRIGRKLRPMLSGDFAGFPNVKGYPMSPILRDRIYGDILKVTP